VEIQRVIKKGLDFFKLHYNDETINKIVLFIEELDKWNQHLNLTGIKKPSAIVEILVYDAFFLFGNVKDSKKILDMGSGSGILAIPIGILSETYGSTRVFSVDKSLKKIQFQRHIKRNLNLERFLPIHTRLETLEPIGVDALIVKGFGTVSQILNIGGKHIKQEGKAFIVKGQNEIPEDTIADFRLEEEKFYSLPFSNRAYKLMVYRKT